VSKSKTVVITRDELNQRLWAAADILRGSIDAADFKNHILSLMFLKRLSDVFEERRAAIIDEWLAAGKSRDEAEQIANDPDEYTSGSYFIPEGARWSDLMKVGENRAEAVDKAIAAIEDENAQYLEGVLGSARFNDERRFGDPQTMDAVMQRLLTHFGNVPLGNRNLAEPDILGNAYEYLIERFAEGSGKKGGEFYTPRMVVKLIVELLKPQEQMRIHDPTCGSGGMLIECGHYVDDRGSNPRNLSLTGQEKNYGTWSICKLNMLLHNFPDADIRAGDTIRSPKFESAGVLDVFDRVIANPPFSLKEWHGVQSEDSKNKVTTKDVQDYWAGDPFHRFTRGVPPATKGDMAFLSHMVEVCNTKGKVGVVMPHGVLFRGGAEAKIRQALLEEDLFEAVIGLPAQLFFGTGIPAAVLILNKAKPKERKTKVLFVDASSEGLYHEGKARNYLRFEDILRVAAAYNAWSAEGLREVDVRAAAGNLAEHWLTAVGMHEERQLKKAAGQPEETLARIREQIARDRSAVETALTHVQHWLDAKSPEGEPIEMQRRPLEKFAAVATLDEIAKENDFNLNISRYVDATEPPPVLDVKAELRALREMEKKRDEAETRMNELLAELGYSTQEAVG
jgi:type I restriction enzyme M protein